MPEREVVVVLFLFTKGVTDLTEVEQLFQSDIYLARAAERAPCNCTEIMLMTG